MSKEFIMPTKRKQVIVKIKPRYGCEKLDNNMWTIIDRYTGVQFQSFQHYSHAKVAVNEANDEYFRIVKWGLADDLAVMELELTF